MSCSHHGEVDARFDCWSVSVSESAQGPWARPQRWVSCIASFQFQAVQTVFLFLICVFCVCHRDHRKSREHNNTKIEEKGKEKYSNFHVQMFMSSCVYSRLQGTSFGEPRGDLGKSPQTGNIYWGFDSRRKPGFHVFSLIVVVCTLLGHRISSTWSISPTTRFASSTASRSSNDSSASCSTTTV